jgi:hypothetical protein
MKKRLTIGKTDIRKGIERWENEGGRVAPVREDWTLKPPSIDYSWRGDEWLSRYRTLKQFKPIGAHYPVLDGPQTP